MPAEQKAVYDRIISGPRGTIGGPLSVWLVRPQLGDLAQALGAYCRFGSLLPARLSELAILATAKFWGSAFEWDAHRPLAVAGGLGEDVIDAIEAGREPPFQQEDEAVVHAFSATLHATRNVPDALYERAVRVLGQEAIVDLVGLLGYYTLASMTINVFGIEASELRDVPRPR
jgi:4-carboxymuconolactone decarboxylase